MQFSCYNTAEHAGFDRAKENGAGRNYGTFYNRREKQGR